MATPGGATDFGALFPLHPSGIVPAGPDLARLVQAIPQP
jgi:putative glutathione S-transferase